MKSACRLCALMCLNYGLIAMSFRLLAKGSYVGVAVSDAAIAWFGFTIMRSVAAAETRLEQVGYTLGGVVGSLIGLWLTS